MAKPKQEAGCFLSLLGPVLASHRSILLAVCWPGPTANLSHLSFDGVVSANSQCFCCSMDCLRTSSRKKCFSKCFSNFGEKEESRIQLKVLFKLWEFPVTCLADVPRCSFNGKYSSTSTTKAKRLKVFSFCSSVRKDSLRLFHPHRFCDSDLDSVSRVFGAVCLLISPGMSTSVMPPPPKNEKFSPLGANVTRGSTFAPRRII